MDTEQVHRVLRATSVMALYWKRDMHVYHMFCRVFFDIKLSIRYVTGTRYIYELLDTGLCISNLSQAIFRTGDFKLHMYFHVPLFLEFCMQKNLLSTMFNYNSHLRVRKSVQLVMIV